MAGFSKPTLAVTTSDGHNFILIEPLVYTSNAGVTYVMPVAALTDGASTPKGIWNLIPPFGLYWRATVLHDGAYRNTLSIQNSDGTFTPCSLTRDESDDLLLEAMVNLGVSLILREAIYEGVHLGGAIPFDDDRRVKLKAYKASLKQP